MIFLFIILFVMGLCISFSGAFIIVKNTDISTDIELNCFGSFVGVKDFFSHLSVWEWILSIFLIIVGGVMMYFSYIELAPHLTSVLDFKL